MYTRLMTLMIGYFSIYVVANEIPSSSFPEFRRWVISLIFEPFVFVSVSILGMTGIVAYGLLIKWLYNDIKGRGKRKWIENMSVLILCLVSLYFLFLMNIIVMASALLCAVFYGIISISQQRNFARRQDGVE
ncbi:hypothetical protein [Pseudalkalibacillus berkeleyi]|uniref:Uncharacterized protein n=1 Tax=Pseudalkalibacillus berkeleyi TaxID=1069813 RepID=A0ABS9H1U7_9BACL|nr:hypothetical protein [Pseudalkalibacillus berkeleyi]MCF6137605.1 hypothetical protein [Pseudalkalibacillus berkeleyi]